MYKLNGATGDKTGLGITLRVMAGDNVSIYGKSYWTGSSPNNSYLTVVNDLLTALAATSAVANSGKGATAGALTGSSVTPNEVASFLSTAPLVSGRPKAYINWILFDEQFRAVSSSSGFSAVNSTSGLLNTHTQGVSISKNGYLYVYCSNESNIDVFFDNLQVIQTRGPLLEETAYSAWGLTLQGISSKAAGKLENRYKYNGIELDEDLGLNVYEAFYRNLDPALGRWWQIDPKVDAGYESVSPYASMYDDPIRYSDPLGDEGDDGFFKQAWQNFKDNMSGARDKVVGLLVQGGANLKENIDNGRTLPQQLAGDFHENPLSAITGMGRLKAAATLLLPELKTLTAVGSEAKAVVEIKAEVKAVDYSGLKEPKKVGEGLPTTTAQRQRILEANKQVNGGLLKSDKSGKVLDVPTKSKKGVPANMNQAEVDHVKAKSKGGSNSNANMQVLSKEENIKKSNN